MTALAIDYVDQHTQQAFHIPVRDLRAPRTQQEYENLEQLLNHLIDEVRDCEDHPLVDVMEIVGEQLEAYDEIHHPPIGENITNAEMVKYLMQTHGLVQKDLASVFGDQGNVSRFLNGERALNCKHISQLKQIFNISADAFIRYGVSTSV